MTLARFEWETIFGSDFLFEDVAFDGNDSALFAAFIVGDIFVLSMPDLDRFENGIILTSDLVKMGRTRTKFESDFAVTAGAGDDCDVILGLGGGVTFNDEDDVLDDEVCVTTVVVEDGLFEISTGASVESLLPVIRLELSLQ